jgi:hypothetical protein
MFMWFRILGPGWGPPTKIYFWKLELFHLFLLCFHDNYRFSCLLFTKSYQIYLLFNMCYYFWRKWWWPWSFYCFLCLLCPSKSEYITITTRGTCKTPFICHLLLKTKGFFLFSSSSDSKIEGYPLLFLCLSNFAFDGDWLDCCKDHLSFCNCSTLKH